MSIIDRVKSKMDEYGLEIYNDYQISENEHVFYVEDMILFVNPNDKSIGVSFQANIRPDRAANITLILNEMKTEIDIMDPFVFDINERCLTGEKAYDLLERSRQSEVIQEFLKDQALKELLMSENCYEC